MVETVVLKPVQDANDFEGEQKSSCIVLPSPKQKPPSKLYGKIAVL